MKWSLLYIASEWLIRLIMLVYVPQNRSAAASRTWLLLIFLLPWPGLVLYALFGRIYVPAQRIERQQRASRRIRLVQAQMAPQVAAVPAFAPLAALACELGDFAPFGGNRIELLTDYTGSIDRLIQDIGEAKTHAHLLFYIFEDDPEGRRVATALSSAAKRGVKCRLMLDAVGSKRALRHLAPGLRADGVETIAMLPVGLFRENAARFDLRNHRKIAVIDGRIGYTGSQNIVRGTFVEGYPNEELMARITGPVVAQLQAVFLTDRFFETSDVLEAPDLFPEIPAAGPSIAQVVPSGPGYQRENGQELMVSLLYIARRRVVITTPYFVPDEPFLLAIRSAVRRGVEVHLVVSAHANQRVTQMAQRSYYDELLQSGVSIHLYEPRFLHAKHFTVDEDVALIGSTNIDIRSFALNSEINLLIYDPAVIAEIIRLQEDCFRQSTMLSLEEWRRRPLLHRTVQSVARLADSLL
jgi:cardiolipin synthase